MRRTMIGMTLIEVAVALTMLSLLALGMLSAFRIGQKSYMQVIHSTTQSKEILAAHRTLRSLIEAMEPSDTSRASTQTPSLEGTTESLFLTAPAPVSVGGLSRYRIALITRPSGLSDLVVFWSDDYAAPTMNLSDKTTPEILVSGLQRIRWHYRAAPSRDPSGKMQDSPWQSSWQDPRHPPALITLQIDFPQGDTRRWPEFIATPLVTDTSRCEFDVVAQACRESGT